jgi:hypothetical protein
MGQYIFSSHKQVRQTEGRVECSYWRTADTHTIR